MNTFNSIDPHVKLEVKDTIDCKGQFALRGLLDAYMHFESTLLSPEALAEVMVPQGTTTIFADLMEIAMWQVDQQGIDYHIACRLRCLQEYQQLCMVC